MEESIIAGFAREEGEDIEEVLDSVEKQTQEEAPAESQAEKEEVDLKKNDAWKKMREEKEESDRRASELEARLQAIEKDRVKDEPVGQPEFLTDMIGENQEVARKFRAHEEELVVRIKAQLVQEQADAARKEKEQLDYWNKWTDEQFVKVGISDDSEKNELRKIMLEYSPTDDKGNLDYSKGKKILDTLKEKDVKEDRDRVTAKKVIADATVSKQDDAGKKDKGYVTSAELRNRGWR